MKLTPQSATQVLDQYYLEARAKLLDLAAIMDRIHRGAGGADLADPRLERLYKGLQIIGEPSTERAGQLQNLFSLPYDPKWERPAPR